MLAWVKRIFFVVVAFTLLAAVSGVVYEQWSRHNLVVNHPPPGRMVEVNGHKLHLNCTGSGSPTVVFESAWGLMGSLDFVLVQPEIAVSHRTCTYDRAGISWSERRTGTPSAIQIADDLHTLLANASESGPYVLAGQSLGGLLIRVFAQRYPQDVAGMLFIEPSHPEQFERFAAIDGSEPQEYPQWTRMKQRILVEFGAARSFGLLDFDNLPIEARIANEFLPYSFVAIAEEELAWPLIFEQTESASSFGDLPILVLTGAKMVATVTPEDAETMSPEDVRWFNEFSRVMLELRDEIAAVSSNGEHRVIEGSGHSMSSDVPQAVIRGVRDVIANCCGDQHDTEQTGNEPSEL